MYGIIRDKRFPNLIVLFYIFENGDHLLVVTNVICVNGFVQMFSFL